MGWCRWGYQIEDKEDERGGVLVELKSNEYQLRAEIGVW